MTSLRNISQIAGRVLLAEKAKMEDALALFRPTEKQEPFFLTFSTDMILEVLLGGGNRAGKSVCAAAAMASFISGKPIIFRDGRKIHMRPERWRKSGIRIWIFGYDWRHIGKTIYRLLFLKDAFRVVFDKSLGRYRAWNPELAGEVPYAETEPSPPLLRWSEIVGGRAGVSWENKKEHQLTSFEMTHDGTQVLFFPSTGAVPQGDPAHLIWIDEKIESDSLYSELLVRLIDFRGRLLWTTWPTTAPSDALAQAYDRAEQQAGKPDQKSFSFTFKGSDNPYTKSGHRDAIMNTMDEDTRAARDGGEMGLSRWRVYPRFSRFIHRVLGPDPGGDDAVAREIRKINAIPQNWTRYMILDPGTQHPGVLFVAVPPPTFGDYVVPYDEIYLSNIPAKRLAEAIAAKTKHQWFEDFIVDAHAARQTPMGFDGTIGDNYSKELAALNVFCARHGSRFSFGSDNIEGRILRLQANLNIRDNGTVRLRILTDQCPHLIRQLETYRWAKGPNDQPTEVPAKHQHIDIAVCLEYFLSRNDCGYVPPKKVTPIDHKSFKEVHRAISGIFGSRATGKKSETSIYCGAGAAPFN